MKTKTIPFGIISTIMLLITMIGVNAQSYIQGEQIEIQTKCIHNGVNGATSGNITIYYPHGGVFTQQDITASNNELTYSGTADNTIGNYSYELNCIHNATINKQKGKFDVQSIQEGNGISIGIILWLATFIIIYFLIYRQGGIIMQLVGSLLIWLNGMLGIYITDHMITGGIMLITLIFFVLNVIRISVGETK